MNVGANEQAAMLQQQKKQKGLRYILLSIIILAAPTPAKLHAKACHNDRLVMPDLAYKLHDAPINMDNNTVGLQIN